MKMGCFLIAVALLSGIISVPTWAHPKTDVIVLYNGDTITGELKSMFGGIAVLSTEALGTAKVEWKHIARIESKYHYDIRFSSGERHYAGIVDSSVAGQIKLLAEGKKYSYEMLEVVEMRPIESTFLDRLDLYLSAGYSFNKASSVAQTTFNTEISYEDENSVNTFTGRTIITDTNENLTESAKFNISRQVWTDRSKSFRTFYGRIESNDELGLKLRYTGGAGLGRYFIDTQKLRWLGSSGLQVLTEEATEGGKSTDSLEVFFSTEFAIWRFDTPEMDVDVKFNLYPSLTEKGRLRGDTDIRIRWELVEDLFWDITAFGTYDNDTEIGQQVDYGLTTGIGWTY